VPQEQAVQPSVFEVAFVNSAYSPGMHSEGSQSVTLPPMDHLPVPHSMQPSIGDFAAIFVAFMPASQFESVQDVTLPPSEY